jgi:hypothetical protein
MHTKKYTRMIRILSCLMFLLAPFAARAAPEACKAAATGIEDALRSFDPQDSEARISIASAVQEHPAASLDFGTKLDAGELDGFPLSQEERGQFANAVAMIYRAGDLNGFVMLDAVRGTANCHSPLLFSTASGSLLPLKVPAPNDPFELCLHGGVALGDAGGAPFYAQTENDNLETDELKIFARKDAVLSHACTISASYEIAYEAAESFCKEPALCTAFAARAAKWAAQFATAGGSIGDPALIRALEGAPRAGDGALPLFGAAQSRLVPQAFRFGASDAWFALKGDPRVDFVRIGPAAEGPAAMANWKAFTLVAFYKAGEPLASFVIEKRRAAFKSLSIKDPEK